VPIACKGAELPGSGHLSDRINGLKSLLLRKSTSTGWRGRAATERFSAQLPHANWIGPERPRRRGTKISGAFANNDLQIKASYGSSPPRRTNFTLTSRP